jgi:hypothetical protein
MNQESRKTGRKSVESAPGIPFSEFKACILEAAVSGEFRG